MRTKMEESINCWAVKRKAALLMEIIQNKPMASEAGRSFGIGPSAIEEWVGETMRGLENALRTKPLKVKSQTSA
jgi:hypothetical protein